MAKVVFFYIYFFFAENFYYYYYFLYHSFISRTEINIFNLFFIWVFMGNSCQSLPTSVRTTTCMKKNEVSIIVRTYYVSVIIQIYSFYLNIFVCNPVYDTFCEGLMVWTRSTYRPTECNVLILTTRKIDRFFRVSSYRLWV